MTPNGVVFAVFIIGAALAAGPRGLIILALTAAMFAIVEVGWRVHVALWRAVLVMAPLAAFMLIVWVGVVGRAPSEIAAGAEGSRLAALIYVATICARLFLIVFTLNAVVQRFDAMTPLTFLRALRLPLPLKRHLMLTLSLIETLRHSVDRAYTALVSAGVVTRRFSIRNLVNGWVLIQTVWLTVITSVTARLRDKWPVENSLALLDPALGRGEARLSRDDLTWIILSAAAAVAVLVADLHGKA